MTMTDEEIQSAVRSHPAMQNATGTLIEEVAQATQTLRTFMAQINLAPIGEVVNILHTANHQMSVATATAGRVSMLEGYVTEQMTTQRDAEAGEKKPKGKAPQPKRPVARKKTTTRKKGTT